MTADTVQQLMVMRPPNGISLISNVPTEEQAIIAKLSLSELLCDGWRAIANSTILIPVQAGPSAPGGGQAMQPLHFLTLVRTVPRPKLAPRLNIPTSEGE
jgi:hypothetical protein